MAVEELVRGHLKRFSQPEHIVGVKKQVQITAAEIKTRQPRMASEAELLVVLQSFTVKAVQIIEVDVLHGFGNPQPAGRVFICG